MKDELRVRVEDATSEQLLVQILREQWKIQDALKALGRKMTELTGAVDDLKSAVDGVAQRLLPQIQALEAALAQAQADDTISAELAAEVQSALGGIRTETDRLNALGTDPSTPVDTEAPPVDPPEVEVPAEETPAEEA